MDRTIDDLAVGMVEASTEFDWAELPEDVQAKILDAAAALRRWANPPTLQISENRKAARQADFIESTT